MVHRQTLGATSALIILFYQALCLQVLQLPCHPPDHAVVNAVDLGDAVGAKGSSAWNGCDLSTFDVVAVVKMDGSVDYIQGEFASDSAS